MIVYNWGDDSNQNLDSVMNLKNTEYDCKRGKGDDSIYCAFIKNEDERNSKKLAIKMSDALFEARGRRKYGVGQSDFWTVYYIQYF